MTEINGDNKTLKSIKTYKTDSVRQTVPDIDQSTREEIYSAFATSRPVQDI